MIVHILEVASTRLFYTDVAALIRHVSTLKMSLTRCSLVVTDTAEEDLNVFSAYQELMCDNEQVFGKLLEELLTQEHAANLLRAIDAESCRDNN